MRFEVEMTPMAKGKIRYAVHRHVHGRGLFNLFGWHTWLVFGLVITIWVANNIYGLIFRDGYFNSFSLIDWGIFIWMTMILPRFFKQFRNWVFSKGASADPIPELVPGLNSGPMTIELSETGLGLTRPLVVEHFDWKIINTVFEKRKQIYLASGHNPIAVLPANEEIRAFLQHTGYRIDR